MCWHYITRPGGIGWNQWVSFEHFGRPCEMILWLVGVVASLNKLLKVCDAGIIGA